MTKTDSSAKPTDDSTSTPFDAATEANDSLPSHEDMQARSSDDSVNTDKPEDDDTCCGDACTSKTCKCVLKALDFGLSDHSPHGR